MKLSELKTGETGVILKVSGHGGFRKRIIEMGFIKGKTVEVLLNAPLHDPVKYKIMGYEVSLRHSEADQIEVLPDTVDPAQVEDVEYEESEQSAGSTSYDSTDKELTPKKQPDAVQQKSRTINVALVGNPNCGKTSLFNFASGAHERVGNYSGVTVDAKVGHASFDGYEFNLVDLPGTYSLSAYSPEELYVRKQLVDKTPDVVINVIDASNLERNLYLTTQLIDMHIRMVCALNMYDETEQRGDHIDAQKLSELFGIPMIPTVFTNGRGVQELFRQIIAVYEGTEDESLKFRHIHINHGHEIEHGIEEMQEHLKKYPELYRRYSTRVIDHVLTNKYFGFPIFFLVLLVMFTATFVLGQYPMDWIEAGVDWLGQFISTNMPDGPVKDMIVDGIIGGVGAVIVFLPQILILYFFISYMEDCGYMSRAAFIMDRLMHKMGLHGKSFIPLIMGFGCNVPAVMATRTIESRRSRLVTMLILPLMSCSARLPIYVMITGSFFAMKYRSLAMLSLYIIGVLMAVVISRLFSAFVVKGEDTPFVMELPPYRFPTWKAIGRHTWEKGKQYLKKMGGIILVASIIVWALGYFPLPDDPNMGKQARQEQSYIGRIGKTVEPVFRPQGFNWKLDVGLLSGMGAKEIVASTMGVLYSNDDSFSDDSGYSSEVGKYSKLHNLITKDVATMHHVSYEEAEPIATLTAFAFLLFVLLYFPCVATIAAIKGETGSWGWALFAAGYTTALAWIVSAVVFQVGMLFI